MKVEAMKLGSDNKKFLHEFSDACHEIARSGQYILGKWTTEMEEKAHNHFGGETIAYSSATDALRMILRAKHITDLILPAMSFSSSLAVCLELGITPHIIDGPTPNMGLDMSFFDRFNVHQFHAEHKVAFLLSHFGGGVYTNTPEALATIRRTIPKAYIIEDFSHSWGAVLNESCMAGTFGDVSLASLYATKPLHCGVGCLISINDGDTDLTAKLRRMREYGRDPEKGTSILTEIGGDFRVSEMEAALFCCNFEKYEDETKARLAHLAVYEKELRDVVRWGACTPNGYRALYITRKPTELRKFLAEKGIGTVGLVYDAPVQASPIFGNVARRVSTPFADFWCANHVCLPLYAALTDEERDYVIEMVKEFDKAHAL